MNISANEELNNTLEDGLWRDSFDRLLDEKPGLIELNMLKKNVRASFNMDSSIENSDDVPGFFKERKRLKKSTKVISTPVGKPFKHPFKCKISPIHAKTCTALFKPNNSKVKRQQYAPRNMNLQSTVIHPSTGVLEYSSIKQPTLQNNSNEDILEMLLTQPKKVGKLSRLRSCNAPDTGFKSKCKIKAKNQQKENKKRQALTVGKGLSKVPTRNSAAIQNANKSTLRIRSGRSKCLTQVQQKDSGHAHISFNAATNGEPICANTLIDTSETHLKSYKKQSNTPTSKKQQSKLKRTSENVAVISSERNGIKSCVISETIECQSKKAGASQSTQFLSDALIDSVTRRGSNVKADTMVTVRRSRKTFKDLPITSNEGSDKRDQNQENLVNMPQTIPASIGIIQSQAPRRSSRRIKSVLTENIFEIDSLTCKNAGGMNGNLQLNEQNCNYTNNFSKNTSYQQTSQLVEVLSENVEENSGKTSSGLKSVSDVASAVEKSINNLTGLAGNTELIETRQRRSNQPNSRLTQTVLATNSFEATLTARRARNSYGIMQDIEEVLPETNREEASSDNTRNIAPEENKIISKYMSGDINPQSNQNDEKYEGLVCDTKTIQKRQSRSSRRTSKLTENVIEVPLLTSENMRSINENLQVYVESNLEEAPLRSSSSGSLNHILDAMITVRKSKDNSKYVSSRINEQSIRNDDKSAERGEQALAKPICNPVILKLPGSPKENLEDSVNRIAVSSRISNPMVTVRKTRHNSVNLIAKTADRNMQLVPVEDNKPVERPSVNTSHQRNSRNVSSRNKTKSTSQLVNTEKNIEEMSSIDQEIALLEDQIDCSLNNFEILTITDESAGKRASQPTIERRRNQHKAPLVTSRAPSSRSLRQTLSSVQEVIEENEQIEQDTLQMTNIMKPNEAQAQSKQRMVKFIEVPSKSPATQREKSANAQNNDSDVIFVEENEQTGQNVNRKNTKPFGMRVHSRAIENKEKNDLIAKESSKNLTVNLSLQAGKWRKSLSVLRRSQITQVQLRQSYYRHISQLESIADNEESVEYIGSTTFVGKRKTILIKPENVTLSQESFVNITDYKKRVLRYCKQNSPLGFGVLYAEDQMPNCSKIGEGVYGEVFMKKVDNDFVVCKIIPIEGSVLVNGEIQKTFEQILPEIVISKELSRLKDPATYVNHTTSGFVDIKKVACVEGKYPQHLIKCWETYDNVKISENDHPGDFPEKQLYIVLELEFAGKDLETFVFNNAEQSFAAFQQIVVTLAVAEEALEFEHRDLHWGNVLISQTNDSEIQYKLSGETFTVLTRGIKATIIDYTLSRMKYENHCFYNDLTNDEELFTATGDYQFDIYRMMRNILGSNWERFEPKTNIFWLSYIISKMENGVKYKNTRSKTHLQNLRKLTALKNQILDFDSACSFAKHMLNKL